jgi:hypothetical protein
MRHYGRGSEHGQRYQSLQRRERGQYSACTYQKKDLFSCKTQTYTINRDYREPESAFLPTKQ